MITIVTTALFLCIAPVSANERIPLSKTALAAFAHGARINVCFHVCDSNGKPVEGASVDIGLSQEANGKFKDDSGKTDKEGNWMVEAKCSGVANARIRKDGYYETRIEKHLFSVDHEEVNRKITVDGWQPWEQTIILKEKRSPTSMFLVESKMFHVPLDISVGFDFIAGDLTVPFGKGSVADVTMQITSTNYPTKKISSADQLRVEVNTDDGGILILQQDTDSRMKSVYRAPTNGFNRVTTFLRNRTNSGSGNKYDMAMGEEEYIVFRVRVEKDKYGKIIKSKYGKIYKLKFGDEGTNGQNGYILLSYYLNPTDNDTNLEWDGNELNTGRQYQIEKILAPL